MRIGQCRDHAGRLYMHTSAPVSYCLGLPGNWKLNSLERNLWESEDLTSVYFCCDLQAFSPQEGDQG